ncbi:MAG: hypothetical protein A2622_09610 [Bdellovibrionales bacterium RIFCSPHIGHO2_01_FULL_40_29]|nr:MAG: hypothetical protein A2622_09610 [Bdellovibrionales bacterium RIFCSPHIGHO2_01_FULL_40_29]OFZ33522.1 MAG: hypothetical protein A3D17_00010 [Bdellovibrionales bacterium RIFCSPHIGHO2_02_FULL_40_15]
MTCVSLAQKFKQQLSQSESGAAILKLMPKLLTDQAKIERAKGILNLITDREAEANQVIDTLVRIKGTNPVLLGEAGVGKTAVVEKVSQMIALGSVPRAKVFSKEILNAEIIQLEASSVKQLGKRPEDAALALVNHLKQIEKDTGVPVILFIDEIHSLDSDMWDVLKTAMDAKDGIRLIGATTEREFQLKFGNEEAMLRRFAPVGVAEFTEERSIEILSGSWKSQIEKRYDVEISDELIKQVVKNYKKILPDVARPDGPIKVLVDLAVQAHRHTVKKIATADFFKFVKDRTKIPANPQDLNEINSFMKEKESILKSRILGQDRMVESTLSVYRNLLLSGGDKPQVIMLMGSTGVGKTYLAESVAQALFGGEHRFFKIDGSAYATKVNGSSPLSSLLGPKPGTVGYKETTGSLIEWMSNPGKGRFGGVLLIDEIEKMHPDTLKELAMNLFDKGEVSAGNGKKIKVPNLLIMGTTNHAVNQVLPEGYQNWSEEELRKRIADFDQKDLKNLFIQPTEADSDFKWPREIVNRIGTYIFANPITNQEAFRISKLEFAKRIKIYSERNNLQFKIEDDVIQFLTDQVFNREDGVRDLSRSIESFFNIVTKRITSGVIQIKMDRQGSKNNWSFLVSNGKEQIKITDHPFKKAQNAASIEELKDLKTLTNRVNNEIYGQDEMIQKVINVVRNWRVLPSGKPLTIIAVGSTGTGKTETAKVLAKELYGSEAKAPIVAMGDVGRIENLNKIFGSDPGFVKSNQMGTFEKALLQVMSGGFLVLDEISNAGGTDKNQRQEIMFKFYNIIEEGFWISPNTGRRYDLSKVIFWMTGNDMQDYYYGVSSDDMRESIYNRIKDENNVRSELRKRGFPEAILGRAQLVVHTKPLLTQHTLGISQRVVNKSVENIRKNFPGAEVIISEATIKTANEVFFNHDQGGRSIRNKFESEIQGLISESILLTDTTPENAQDRVFEVKIVDGRSKKHYAIKGLQQYFLVEVVVKNRKGETLQKVSNDLASKVDLSKPDASELVKVSFHEIGHAMLNDENVSGQRLRFVTIKPGSSGDGSRYLGYAAYDDVKKKNTGLTELRRNLMRIVAGRVAQEVAGFQPDRGWQSDYNKMVKLISSFYVTSGLDPKLWGTSFDKENRLVGTSAQQEYFHQLIIAEITKAQDQTREYLTAHIGLLRFLTAQLVKNQSLTGEQFRIYLEGFKSGMNSRQIQKGKVVVIDKIVQKNGSSKNSVMSCKKLFN